jgi:hypothetical protein
MKLYISMLYRKEHSTQRKLKEQNLNLIICRFLLEFELSANLNPLDSTVYLTKQKSSK